MSLHQLAHHMKNAGRGEDKMLMHMTPGEVHGLQKLALAHGGSLTINPETGLPEAGFLSSILPTLLGAGLTIASGGALSPLMAAGLVGGGTALATGSLEKGLMAGLGAYGGAGFGAGLGSLGGAAASAGTGATTAAGSVAADVARNVASGAIRGSTGIVPAITQGTAGAAQSAAAVQAATGALPQYTGYLGGLEKQLTDFPGANIPKPSVPEIAPGVFRGGAAQRIGLNDILNAGQTRVNLNDPTIVEGLEKAVPTVTPPGAQVAYQRTPPHMPPDATTIQPFASGNIAPPPPQMPMDATTKQLFEKYTGGPYTAPSGMPRVDMANINSYPELGGADAIDLGTSVPIEDRSGMQNILRNVADTPDTSNNAMRGLKQATSSWQGLKDLYGEMEKKAPYSGMAAGYSLLSGMNERPKPPKGSKSLIRPYTMKRNRVVDSDVGPSSSAERRYFNDVYTAGTPYEAPGPEYKATGGIVALAGGGTQSASNTYRDGSGFDVSGAAEAVSGSGYDPDYELPQYEYLGNNQYKLKNPVSTTATTAPKLSPTGQPVDASGGYYGPYGQYFNAAGEGQMWYMNPAYANDPEAIKSAKAAGITLKSPTTTTTAASAPVTTQEGLEALYQQNFGRAADASGIESYLGKGYTPEQITGFMQSSEEYKPIKERLEQEAKQATYANPTQIANIYSDVLGRNPDMGGLDYYLEQNLTPEQVEQQLRQSEEYKTNLTKPFVPAISYTGSSQSYDDIKNQLGHNPTLQEIKTANAAFIPNRATIEGAPEYQTPEQQLGLEKTKRLDTTPDFYAMMDAELRKQGGYANGGDVQGYNLGGYSDGGRLLRGPGDGVSDDIPATIGNRQPARLADGEFVIPARIVSELGNGSTEAGAKRLYAMMDRVQKARSKTTGKGKIAVNSKADKHLPA